MQYYKFSTLRALVFLGFLVIFSSLDAPAAVEQFEAITLQQHIEKFEQYRHSDHNKALRFALLVASDLGCDENGTPAAEPSEAELNTRVAAVYDFLSENYELHEFRYQKALNFKLRAESVYRAIGEEQSATRAEAVLGRLYLKEGDYHNAYTHGLNSLQKAQQQSDTLAMREAYITIEQVDFFYHNDVERAMVYNRLVADTHNGAEQADQSVRALNNRFRYPLTPEEVGDIVEQTEALCVEYGIDDMLVNLYLNVALQEVLFGDLDASAHYLALAKPLISNFKEEGYYYSASGFYHINAGNHRAAIEDTKRSIELLAQGDFEDKNVHSYFLLQELYHSEGRYSEAYDALMQFAEIYTRQNNTDNILELSKLINDLQLQHAREQHTRARQFQWLIYLILALVLIALCVLVLFLNTNHKLEIKNRRLLDEKAEQELKNKNEIIKIQKLQQYQEQRNMTKLTEELSAAMESSDNKALRGEIGRIIRQLRKNNDTSDNWVEVEKTIASNNDAFFENLLREYPNLTKNERKLCTFIHLNLSTKEISKITHQSIGSINIARSRLRRKFGLTGGDQSLIAFLDRFRAPEH